MDRIQLKSRAVQLVKAQYGVILLSIIIIMGLTGLVNGLHSVGNVAAILLTGPLLVGAFQVFTRVTAEEPASLSQLFEPLQHNFINCFVTNLLCGVFVMLWSLLLIIPGIIKAYSYAMVPYLLVREPKLTGMDALLRSEELMRGHRLELFHLHLSFFGWIVLCIITCGVACIWVCPYLSISTTLFFDKIYGVKTPDEILGHLPAENI